MFPEVLNRIGEIMVKDVLTIEPARSLVEAAKLMQTRNVGSIVVAENRKIVGIITERDFLRVAAAGLNLAATKVSEVMTQKPIVCDSETKIQDAYIMMVKNKIRHLPIIDNKDRLVGIVSVKDFLSAGQLVL